MSKTMTISLPDEMKKFIERQTRTGKFSSASEFFRQLVREEQRRMQQDELERKLVEGLESESIPATDSYWKGLQRRVEQRIKAARRSRKK